MRGIENKVRVNRTSSKYMVEGKLTLWCGTVEWKPVDLTNDPNQFIKVHPEYDFRRIRFRKIETARL